jgi:peptidoglycan/LPS O-acetylase OafA/YrhL
MVALLGIARRWMNRKGPLTRYARRVGYEIYIVHQPIIIAIAYFVVRWDAPVSEKVWVTLTASTICTIVCSEILARLDITLVLRGFAPRRRVSSASPA